jgi:hypothetical protein
MACRSYRSLGRPRSRARRARRARRATPTEGSTPPAIPSEQDAKAWLPLLASAGNLRYAVNAGDVAHGGSRDALETSRPPGFRGTVRRGFAGSMPKRMASAMPPVSSRATPPAFTFTPASHNGFQEAEGGEQRPGAARGPSRNGAPACKLRDGSSRTVTSARSRACFPPSRTVGHPAPTAGRPSLVRTGCGEWRTTRAIRQGWNMPCILVSAFQPDLSVGPRL